MQELILIGILLFQTPASRPTGGMSGRVVFADGAFVAEMRVTAVPVSEPGQQSGRSFPPIVFTDKSGEFSLRNVPPGRYYIQFGTGGEPPIYYPGVAMESGASVVTVADTIVGGLNFTFPLSLSGVRVSGHVTFPPNRSFQGVEGIELRGPGKLMASRIAPDGTFEFLHVRPGRYTITVDSAPGMQVRPISVADLDLAGIELVAPRLMPFSGMVNIEGSSARPRFLFAFESAVYGAIVEVAPDGTFTLQLPEGSYLPRLTGLASGYYLKSFTAGDINLLANPLKIAPSDSAVPINLTIGVSAGVKIRGRVVCIECCNSSTSIKGVVLFGRMTDQVVELPIEEDGSFKLEKVMPGAYVARVTLESGLDASGVPVVIPDKDVVDLEIAAPGEVEVLGRVTADGYGPPPKFPLLLLQSPSADLSMDKSGEIPSLLTTDLLSLRRSAVSETQAVQINVNALPDGTFKMKLPEGTYRIVAASGTNGVPPPYFLRELTYGAADLFKESMVVSAANPAGLQIGFGTSVPNPWVKLSGKVLGSDPLEGPFRVVLEGTITSGLETPVSQDGSFEFLRVLQGTTYTARLLPANDAASAPTVHVSDKDLAGVEIIVVPEKEVRILPIVDDGAPIPGFVMSFAGSGSMVTVIVKPERNGTFRAKLPVDERRVKISGFPVGYVLKSASYGSTDLLKQPLKITADDFAELRVTFGIDPRLASGSLRGRVIGLDRERQAAVLVLNDVAAFSSFEATVSPDGLFSFSKIPQGTYVPSLLGAGVSGLLSPSTVVVSGTDLFGIELIAPKQSTKPERSLIDEGPTGVVVSNLGGSRESANESSAVAQLRTVNTAEVTFLTSNGGKYGTIPDLIKAGLLDRRFNGVISGFRFSVTVVGQDYAAAAIPALQGAARYGYFSTSDAVVRYSTVDPLAPPRQGGNPVQ